ncbi:hypothetical protein [Hymenobacter sp. B81]|uniref:hypothetical protein n=1 Tax=Hymenobacter sp. B81 TaxID=3344878 RepID=UPI0037DD896B
MHCANDPGLQFDYHFWCWKPKLNAVLKMLSLLSDFRYNVADEPLVLAGLRGTDDERGWWFPYDLSCNGTLSVTLAYDAADSDIVHVAVLADPSMAGSIRLIDQIQCVLKQVEVADES